MALSLAHYPSDGIQTDFAIPFSYIKKEYVKVYGSELDSRGRVVGERQPLSYSWLNTGTIRLDTPAPAGYRITVERETFASQSLVDFQDAALITEEDLNLAAMQPLHVAQEARDRNGYEILEASRNVSIGVDEAKEYAERTEDAAADAEQSLQECENFSASTERAKLDTLAAKNEAQNLRDSIGEDVVLIQQKAAEVAVNTDKVDTLAGEVIRNTNTVVECTSVVQVNTDKVENWTAVTSAANAAAADAAQRAEYAAAVAEAAGGIDSSIFVEKVDFNATVKDVSEQISLKADDAAVAEKLATKSDVNHRHKQEDVENLPAILALKADAATLKSMAFTSDAPLDGKMHGRKNGAWAEVKDISFPLMVGQVTPYFGAVADKASFEPNFLYADGRAVSRTQYPELFAAYGTVYGAGNGSTTFNLPDLRGAFVRGLDAGRGLDPGRALGTFQGDAIRDIQGDTGTGAGTPGVHAQPTGPFHVSSKPTNTLWFYTTGAYAQLGFKASNCVPTARENRPVNMACHWFVVAQSPAVASVADFTSAVNAVNSAVDTVRVEMKQRLDCQQTFYVQDRRASGIGGGTATAGAWRTRELNWSSGKLTGASLNPSTSTVTLPAGTYDVLGFVSVWAVRRSASRLRSTAGTVYVMSSSQVPETSQGTTAFTILSGSMTLTRAESLIVETYPVTTYATYGFGYPVTIPNTEEVYSQLSFRKVT